MTAVLYIVGIAVAAHVVTVIAALHARSRISPIAVHAMSAAIWHAVQIVTLAAMGMSKFYWQITAFTGLCVMAYVFAYSALYKSISLRVLIQLAASDSNGTDVDEMCRLVAMRNFHNRVALLLANGWIDYTTDGYFCTKQGQRVVRRVMALRRLFGIAASGLYFRQ